ncbi:MAG: DMT family transporter [Pseudomonadota bacterium]|jgi:drug/metabolite transporter (DMT)-like permease
MKSADPAKTLAVSALLAGAVVWGLIWYPYRLLESAGVSGALSSTLTYLAALLLGLAVLRKAWRQARWSWMLVPIALAGGGCNLGYVLATLHGEVMRVLLLFYLAPLWTVLLSRLLLGERLTGAGAAVIGFSVAGTFVMLWHPALGAPFPRNGAEWIGMASGFLFALTNVLVRRAAHLTIEIKSLAVFAGVVLLGLAALPLEGTETGMHHAPSVWLMIVVIGLVLLVINLVVQYGLMRAPANQAIVILLFELVVAAVSSWLLAGEAMSVQEWLGGAMIVTASLFSGRMEEQKA